MVNDKYEKTKQPLIHSGKAVERAGECIRKNNGDYDEAVKVIQGFRAAHIYPLTIIKNLVWKEVRRLKLDDKATIVRRLKRLPTIIDKLQRKTLDGVTANTMKLTQMHDIGGCRVIVDSMKELHLLNDSLSAKTSTHEFQVYDYISSPKPTGYRGIHRVYKSFSKIHQHDFKGRKIEVQIRTKLQHLWATTVEVIDLIENETLKTRPDGANADWKRALVIMSKFFAVEEGVGKMTVENKSRYKKELRDLNDKLSIFSKLSGFQRALKVDYINKNINASAYTLLVVDEAGKGKGISFSKNRESIALAKYAEYEKDKTLNVLLIAGSDIKSIEKAYPNYISDTSEFLHRFSSIVLS